MPVPHVGWRASTRSKSKTTGVVGGELSCVALSGDGVNPSLEPRARAYRDVFTAVLERALASRGASARTPNRVAPRSPFLLPDAIRARRPRPAMSRRRSVAGGR